MGGGLYIKLDTILWGWILGGMGLVLHAFRDGIGRDELERFWNQECLLYGNWAEDVRESMGRWTFSAAVLLLQVETFFLNSLVRELIRPGMYELYTEVVDFAYMWLLVAKLLFFTRYSGKQLLVGGSFFFCLRWVYLNNHSFWMIIGVLFALAAKDVKLRRLLRFCLIVSVVCACLVIGGALVGIIPSLTEEGQRVRNSFGYGWHNTAGAVIFSICLMYLCLKRITNITCLDLLMSVMAAAFCFLGPNSRAAGICILLLQVCVLMARFVPSGWKIAEKIFFLLPVAAFGSSYILSLFYTPENPLLYAINQMFSGRLELGHEALSATRIAIAGQGLWNETFLVDNFYVYLWIYAGPVASVLIWGAVSILLWKLVHNGSETEVIGMIVMVFYATQETTFIWPCYNVLLWMLSRVLFAQPGVEDFSAWNRDAGICRLVEPIHGLREYPTVGE